MAAVITVYGVNTEAPCAAVLEFTLWAFLEPA